MSLPSELIEKAAMIFKVLSDPTRLKILQLIQTEEVSVNEIAERLQMTQSAVSHQLRLLKSANVVSVRRSGTTKFYALADHHIVSLMHSAFEHVGHD